MNESIATILDYVAIASPYAFVLLGAIGLSLSRRAYYQEEILMMPHESRAKLEVFREYLANDSTDSEAQSQTFATA